jgi:hypothetical protein
MTRFSVICYQEKALPLPVEDSPRHGEFVHRQTWGALATWFTLRRVG